MSQDWNRRDFLSLVGIGGLVFASGLPACATGAEATTLPRAPAPTPPPDDFFFLQLSDTHWGFKGPPNPMADVTLERAVATINAVDLVPDFVVFTGDLIHMTEDAVQRRERMKRFREIASALKVKDVRFLPGEHDAAPDRGEAYREVFGEPSYSFVHKGVHFVTIDNVSLPGGAIGEPQLQWLAAELSRIPEDARVVVLTHRPLFQLAPEWDWATKDGDRAIEMLSKRHVTVFYGHIHQEHHQMTGNIAHHAARSLVFPLPPPGAPKRAPLPWTPASSDHGLGWRSVTPSKEPPSIREIPFR